MGLICERVSDWSAVIWDVFICCVWGFICVYRFNFVSFDVLLFVSGGLFVVLREPIFRF